MTNTARALLESALRARHLDRTLTTALAPLERTDATALVPTDIGRLDDVLHGGLPRGHLSEIVGPSSSGRTTVLLSLMAAAARRGEIAALVDTLDRLDVASATAARVDLDRLLWVRGTGGALEMDRAIGQAVKALNLVLQAGGFGLVAIDLADVPLLALQRIPFTTWLRVQRTIEGSDTACVLLAPQPFARSAGGVTLALGAGPSTLLRAGPSTSLKAGLSTPRTTAPATVSGTRPSMPHTARWAGDSDRSRQLAGLDVAGRVISPRRHVDGEIAFAADAGATTGGCPYGA